MVHHLDEITYHSNYSCYADHLDRLFIQIDKIVQEKCTSLRLIVNILKVIE